MSDVQTGAPALDPENTWQGPHGQRVRQTILNSKALMPADRWISEAPAQGGFPEWYLKARKIDRDQLKELFGRRWLLQGQLEGLTGQLQQDVRQFAEPLLTNALKETLKVELDVRTAQLRLYVPDTLILGINSGAFHSRHMTLLDAALHNFEAREAETDAFGDGSGVFTLDAEGAPLRHSLSVARFVTLCRQLDLGAQYQAHLKQVLLPDAASAKETLHQQSVDSAKAAFKLAALAAHLKGDITAHAFSQMLAVHDAKPGRALYGAPMLNHRLSLMGFRLSGITLFSAVAEPSWVKNAVDEMTSPALKALLDVSNSVPFLPSQDLERFKLLKAFFANGPKGLSEELARRQDTYNQSRLVGHLVVYIPDDPDHPLKEYASFTEFMTTLTGQLIRADYQAFFSRFVAQKDKGLFFARANERFKTFKWQQRKPLDMGPWWRETAVENPDPEPITNPLTGDLWLSVFNDRRAKLIADARQIAVPTGDEDAKSRWARLTSYLGIVWNIFNFAALLVPGLGEAMLGIMAAQLLEELVEGVEDWSKGDRDEASGHLLSVLINGAQLAMMGAGHVLPKTGLTPIQPSPVFDGLQAVELPSGKPSLWKPDLTPYQHGKPLDKEVSPDALGLHRQDGDVVLPLENARYRVSADPATGEYRIDHPSRPDAYKPRLAHNGAGAWRTELERPLMWDDDKVWQRLGHSLNELPAARQAQVRTVSGADHTALRRMHAEGERPPPLLSDTLKRFRIYTEAQDVSQQILDNRMSDALEGFLPTFVTELPGWPANRAIELFEGPGLSGESITYGHVDATAAQTIKVSRAQLRSGQLPEFVLDALQEPEVRDMLGTRLSTDRAARLDALRARLAMHADRQTRRLFDSLYNASERANEANLRLLQQAYPNLPGSVGERLLRQASAEELRFIEQKGRVPLRLKAQARQALHEVRVVRAYEGLYLGDLASTDTQRLALHSIEALPGWSDRVRIEVRRLSFNGELSDSLGRADAPIRKVLVLNDEGKFEARDAQDQHLHGADELYGAVLHALPDAERKALGYEINQGTQLKDAVQRQPLDHERFAEILQDASVRKPAYDPQTMKLRGGMQGYRHVPSGTSARYRARHLYPGFSEADLDRLIAEFYQRGISYERQIGDLEKEFSDLNNTLQRWVNSRTKAFRFSPTGIAEWTARNEIARRLVRCWQRIGPRGIEAVGEAHPQHLDLSGCGLGDHLTPLPPLSANFKHVTSLSLRNNRLHIGQMGFLQAFDRVRSLDLGSNLLNHLPSVIGDMRYLTELMLGDNRIELSETAVVRLRKLTRLRALSLAGNPIRRLPDISRMPRMQVLVLHNTGIETWPVGLFASPRPRNIFIDMTHNPIRRLPDVAPGSFRAELIARTHVSRGPRWMSAQILERLRLYIESVGMDPERPYPPRGTLDSTQWAEGMSDAQWKRRLDIWETLEDEWGSEPFFNRIRGLTETADFRASGRYRIDLTSKVWRMLEAMGENAELREKLFAEALLPTECVDGLTQVFNAMGIEVLIHEAYRLANPDLIEAELVALARGRSRLRQLDAIARRRVSERLAAKETFRRLDANGEVVGTIDVVEVHLAYMTDLAKRLDLPWQARGMQFRAIAGVSEAMIEAAYERVLALEEGDLLRDAIAEQPFWKTWVETTYAEDFDVLKRRVDWITAYKVAMDERAVEGLAPAAIARLDQQLTELAQALGKPLGEVAPGQIMTDAAYDAELNSAIEEMETLLKTLTQQAMDRARLTRVELPFEVDLQP